jgi:Raf kinase inhibitor-like YbhB/YbcL family protein
MPETATSGRLNVGCEQFKPGEPIPLDYTGYGAGKRPNIKWDSNYPAGTKMMWLIVEDPDAPGSEPFVHLLQGNIPPSRKESADGGEDKQNSHGGTGWYPPTPPAGPPHRYYFELFALDKAIQGNTRDDALKQMNGHVLAKGDFMCMFQKP